MYRKKQEANKGLDASQQGQFVLREAVVELEPGYDPPKAVGDIVCQAMAWADERTVLLSCGPMGNAPEDTEALVAALTQLPGVRKAHPNMIRRKID